MDDGAETSPEMDQSGQDDDPSATGLEHLTARHLMLGWHWLLLFLSLGLVLEGLHAFKVGWYLDVGNDTRRLMLRLAHAHGTLLSLVNIAFAWTVSTVNRSSDRRLTLASLSLLASTVLLPGGFFLGGLFIYSGDPGFGAWLVPVGAAMLFLAVLLTARSVVQQ